MTLSESVQAALDNLLIDPCDGATVQLARQYAAAMDQAACPECGGQRDALEKLGPKLLAVLAALGMTPTARAALVKGGPGEPTSSPLDELRARRDARKDRTAAVDPTP